MFLYLRMKDLIQQKDFATVVMNINMPASVLQHSLIQCSYIRIKEIRYLGMESKAPRKVTENQ